MHVKIMVSKQTADTICMVWESYPVEAIRAYSRNEYKKGGQTADTVWAYRKRHPELDMKEAGE